MKTYQPLLVAAIVGLLLVSCYYVPDGGSTGSLSFYARFTNPDPTYDALRIELFLEEDTTEPLAIGPGGARFIDEPITNPASSDQGPVTIANIPARRRYILRVGVYDYEPGSGGYTWTPRDSSAFEILPGETSHVAVSLC